MEPSASNPLAVLSFISAPAVLTNASCVLLFGAGNRYARAVDRMHELARTVEASLDRQSEDAKFRLTQLEAAESRSLYIVRALTCFYGAVAAFVASTLFGLLGGIAAAEWPALPASVFMGLGLLFGTIGVASMIVGALLLVRESRESFVVLREERRLIGTRLQRKALSQP